MRLPVLAGATILTFAPAVAIAATPERMVRFQDVAFRYDSTLATGVDARIVPAVPLAEPSDVPDGVGPEHILFTFRDAEGAADSRQRDAGTLRVYPVSAYEAIWPPAKETIDALKDLLATRRSEGDEEIPFLPWADVAQPFRSHVEFVEFQNGAGIGFVTAYAIEPSPVTNRVLEYTFQGLTADGTAYVSLSFPIATAILKDEERVDDWEAFTRGYDAYVSDQARRLDDLPPHAFVPGLDRIDAMMRSLCVKQPSCLDAEAPKIDAR
jgi:hypothetical protein